MSEKRRGRKRKEEFPGDAEDKVDKPSKDEYTIAKWMRDNVPNKRTKFIGHNVQYFTGSKAVDALMESKWAKPEKEGAEPFFTSRGHCVDFLDLMLRHKFYHRAKKVPQEKVLDAEARKKKALKEKKKPSSSVEDKKEKKSDKEKESGDHDGNSSHPEGKTETEGEDKKVKKKKVKLDMHLEQVFVDNLDAYVWIYEPTPVYYPIIGTLVVLAAIVICLFPLWPSSVRSIVYYLSVAAACFLVLIITLAVIRFVLFSIIWLLTAGQHHLWILPNLTEDVGFFASFWPLYHYEYKGGDKLKSKGKKSKKGKYKDSDDENNPNDNEQHDEDQQENDEKEKQENTQDEDDNKSSDNEEDIERDKNGEGNGEESGSDGSSSGNTGKDFEILDKDELQQL